MGLRVRDMFDLGDWQPFKCTEAPPAYSVVALNGGTVNKKIFTHTVIKQDATFRFEHGITSPFHPSGSGATKGNLCVGGMCPAKYGDASVAVGDVVGPKPGEWGLWKGYYGFRIREIIDATNKIALVKWEPPNYVGKSSGSISKGSTGTVRIWTKASGTWTAISSWDITAEATGAAITASKFLSLVQVGNLWIATPFEC
jgi:hypothetical protein